MAFCDFVIRYNPETDTGESITKKILYSIFIKRLKANKPVVLFMGGESGEGKSMADLRLQEILFNLQGLDIQTHLKDVNVFTPREYPKKLDALLFDKRLKKVNLLTLHEARDVVRAKLWHSFIAQAVSDVNAQSRSIKRIMFIITSQFIRDITADIRYTLNYYCTVRRPKSKGARLYINVMWKDDSDLEKPKLRKRKLSGYLVHPNGRYQRYVPQYLELGMPAKELAEEFDRIEYEAKASILKTKLGKLMREIEADMGQESKQVDTMVDWYCSDMDRITSVGKMYKGSWKVRPELKDMHGLSDKEMEKFETLLNQKIKERGLAQDEPGTGV